MGVKISALPAIVTPALTDVFPVVQSGVTYKETFTQLSSLFSSVFAELGEDVTFSSVTFSPTTNGVVGTPTNNNAGTGYVGEVISSVIILASATSLTTTVPKNITSIVLTAGDWDLWGNVGFIGNVLTTFEAGVGWINSISASVPDGVLYSQQIYAPAATVFNVGSVNFTVPGYRVSLAAPTTYYLTVNSSFGTSTCNGYGGIYARRRR